MYRFIRNLRIRHKFAVVSLLALPLFVVPTALVVHDRAAAVEAAGTESAGLAGTAGVLRLLQATQQHRLVSTQALAGDAEARSHRAARQAEVDQALVALAPHVKNDPPVARALEDVRTRWEALASDTSTSAPENFARHTALVRQELGLLRAIADAARLSIDPEPATRHLVEGALRDLPQLAESLGQMRANGAAILRQHAASPTERARLQSLADAVREQRERAQATFALAANTDPVLAARIAASMATALEGSAQALALVDTRVLAPEAPDAPPADYVAAMTGAIDAQLALASTAFGALDEALAKRVRAREVELAVLAAGAAAFGLLVLWLSVRVTRHTTRSVELALEVAGAVADGNLGVQVKGRSRDELGRLLDALGRMTTNLSTIVREVRQSSESIATGASQIAGGNADLSVRTEQQASNLQQTAAAMEQIGTTVKSNAETAQEATSTAGRASAAASRGGEIVGEVVSTMGAISDASQRVVDIIGVIDGIAFQTNILALNAAVEAARAGEAGRGFAVVASEVRALATRSAAAAREIKTLITDSVEKIESGASLAADAGAAMNDIVARVQRVNTLMDEISTASTQQARGVGEVSGAVGQLDAVTQQNAALVEESAAAAESLNQQAVRLVELVRVFHGMQEGERA